MIKANELRLGNWVNEDVLGNVIVHRMTYNVAFLLKKYDSFPYSVNYENINPIPLEPEILEKCGFTKEKWDNGSAFGYNLSFEIGNWRIIYQYYSKGSVEFKIESDGGYDYGGEFDLKEKCKFLHQLQNLYFALTGEELEYKS